MRSGADWNLEPDSSAMQTVLGHFATGIILVTAIDDGEPVGMACNSFTSVSLDPPLVLVCAEKTSNTHPVIADGGVFAVNLLRRGQEELSDRFASKKDEERRFVDLDYRVGETGSPLIAGTLASLDCRVRAAHDAGDHVIYVGEVVDAQLDGGEPLLHYARAYHRLAEPE